MTAEIVQPSGGVVTSTLLIKGEIHGSEDLYIDGEVQGSIHLCKSRVTIGPHGRIAADVDAREVVVRGKTRGALTGRERVEIGRSGEVHGNISTLRIAIEEGADVHCKIEITRGETPSSRTAEKSSGWSGHVPMAVKA